MPRMPTTVGDPGDPSAVPPIPPIPPQWTYIEPGEDGFGQVDVVRLLIQDNDPAMPLLGDAELQWLVDQWLPKHDSLYMVAAVAAERVAAKFAGVVSVTADGVSVDVSSLAEKYRVLAADMRATHKDAQVGGEVDITNLMWDENIDWSIAPLSFGVGQHDNLEAGRQDYGTQRGRVGNAGYANELTGGW